ncbi:Type I restriction enzyme R Protein [Bosea sp. 62]|uniref:type I restriction endonuclease subunit R n=1 Tax=unclassified Bosea (in: a-proteobacteria) TaxID=2653178 RepID=UPI00125B933A|nr:MULTISPECIES: HsdR family type I site-specific deoxyribonuclease [unclassified Bosea (in: a-proteobacteria)]CAD5257328.1 Type I restriction enzyme R Protein [Bosea sp. 7B]CAD5272947.1 Type I restriction enzyme R Protein [Bosea sp. 21B]CAD5285184.1 Type I restriction enzyme R Protein [Bosea sp. 46]VVT60261.1 Type I restriction enzyme R Protein [Bosea sp. EC-HK365B]VXB61452.1 Type I restriction enzyme R Protein [Bosea sp. 62]
MTRSPQFTTSEAGGAQLQTLNTLINCGWRYVTKAEADQWRDGRRSLPFLETQLRKDLARINRIHLDGRAHAFSEANIDAAVRRLADRIPEGVLRANERMTDDLLLGIALPQTIGATSREWPFKFIDWADWRANSFQVTAEYTVSEAGGTTIRVDLALFVNGIPLGVIEVKASHVASDEGIGQQIRNQKVGEGVPALFYSAQLLVAANSHDPRYGTVGTPRKLWSVWKEREDPDSFIADVVNRPLDGIEYRRVALDFAPYMKRHDGLMEDGNRFATPLDETLVGLCRPERFMRLVRHYMLFDGPHKKVARYQQVATIEALMKRIKELDAAGKRRGGVVWHTQGSGKSLTMVMLAKSIVMSHTAARMVIVTDRTDLDDQITKTFRATGHEPKRAATGENLLTLIEDRTPIVTTLIHKFRAGLNKRRVVDTSPDIFVLVDESHRSQHGSSKSVALASMHDRMRELLPNACFIAFTGTPIAKKEKSTFAKFGDLVQPAYSMRDAVGDKAVVPLLYEGREVVTDVDEGQIDRWFDVHTRDLSDAQRADLKRKMSRAREIEGIESRLQSIAFDVGQHFLANFKSTGLKGQVAASSKRAAIQLKKLFDTFGVVTTEVVISAPDMRESEDEVDESDDDLVRTFWRRMMDRYGGEDAYNKTIIEQFKGPSDPDIIIVVDKLLTGFDAPRNTVLYVARKLREHGLLQAIARVNRVFDEDGAPEKPFGFIVDYTGVFKDLGEALSAYDELEGFSEVDIAQTIVAIREEAGKVPDAHAALLDVFKSISNTYDAEAYAKLLADEVIREEFYRRLTEFGRSLSVALASPSFIEATKPEALRRWKDDLGRFTALRAAVSLRYAERVDWRDYEKRVRQLLDRHVVARDVIQLVEPLNIFDDLAIEVRRNSKKETDASIADTIAHQLTRIVEEKWDEDPILFDRFSKLVKDTIRKFHEGRLSELEYLAQIKGLRDRVQSGRGEGEPTPERLRSDSHAEAFWGLAKRNLEASGAPDAELAADIALEFSSIVQKRRKVGWQNDRDVENAIRNDIDDFFFEELRGRRGLFIEPSVLDAVVDDVLASARVRLAQ